jgi:GNAT superfamily N-acetyltransferase
LVLKIRMPTADELRRLSSLCFRSKAVWGYDEAFMEACRSELSFDRQDLQVTSIAVADEDGRLSGVVQVKIIDSQADLLKLFVEPGVLRRGIGRALFTWAADISRKMGAIG